MFNNWRLPAPPVANGMLDDRETAWRQQALDCCRKQLARAKDQDVRQVVESFGIHYDENVKAELFQRQLTMDAFFRQGGGWRLRTGQGRCAAGAAADSSQSCYVRAGAAAEAEEVGRWLRKRVRTSENHSAHLGHYTRANSLPRPEGP